MLAKEMSDTQNRGRIIWVFATSRPDLLEVDLKRQGRLDVHIPLFPPQTSAEMRDLLAVMAKKLKVTLKGASKREFLLPLIDVEEKEQKIPSLKFSVTVKTDASVINDAIEDVDIIGESVAFVAAPKAFRISSSSDLSKADVEILADEKTSIEAKEETKSKYSIEYLKKMIQGAKLCDKVTVQFSKDYPLQLDYTVKDKLQLMFILAPRVDND